MKQPKLLSPDAFSELEVCQNALAAGALPPGGPHCRSLHTLRLCSVVPGRNSIALLVPRLSVWPNFSCKQKDHGLFLISPWPSQSHVYLIYNVQDTQQS